MRDTVNIDPELLDVDKEQYVTIDDEYGPVVLQEMKDDPVDISGFVEKDEYVGSLQPRGTGDIVVYFKGRDEYEYIDRAVVEGGEVPVDILEQRGYTTLELIC